MDDERWIRRLLIDEQLPDSSRWAVNNEPAREAIRPTLRPVLRQTNSSHIERAVNQVISSGFPRRQPKFGTQSCKVGANEPSPLISQFVFLF